MTGIVLAGGKSQRMGEGKASLKIGRKQVIELILEKLRVTFDDVLIVGNSNFIYPLSQVRVLADAILGKGPLGGIYTGLLNSKSEYSFFCACDMPFLNIDLLKFIISEIDGSDAVIPMVRGFVEPLHAIYSERCLPAIKNCLENEDLRIKSFFSKVKCKYIPENKIKRYDPSLLSFLNLNTPEAVELVKNLSPSLH